MTVQIYLARAFDRVRHDVLYGNLLHIGFCQTILEGVEMTYTSRTTARIKIEYFPIPLIFELRAPGTSPIASAFLPFFSILFIGVW